MKNWKSREMKREGKWETHYVSRCMVWVLRGSKISVSIFCLVIGSSAFPPLLPITLFLPRAFSVLRSRANMRRAAPVDMYGEAKFGFHSNDERGLGQDCRVLHDFNMVIRLRIDACALTSTSG
jgi:hypothetical protein